MSLDDAARFLRDANGPIDEGDRPPGTVVNIDADFDGHAASGGSGTSTGATCIVEGTSGFRAYFRFPLGVIPSGATVNDTDVQFNVTAVSGVDVGDNANITDYGTSNPSADTVSTRYTNAGGTTYLASTGWNTTGSKSKDLGSTADTNLAARIAAGRFSIGVTAGTSLASPETFEIEADDAASDTATLTVDYTPVFTTTIASTLAKVSSALTAAQSYPTTMASSLVKVSSAFTVTQTIPSTIASSLVKVSAALTADHTGANSTIASSLVKVAAALAADQTIPSTIAVSLIKVAAALTVEQPYTATIATQLVKIADALTANQTIPSTVAATLVKVAADLQAAQTIPSTIATSLVKATASLSVEQPYTTAVAITLIKVAAALSAAQEYPTTIATLLAHVVAEINVTHTLNPASTIAVELAAIVFAGSFSAVPEVIPPHNIGRDYRQPDRPRLRIIEGGPAVLRSPGSASPALRTPGGSSSWQR